MQRLVRSLRSLYHFSLAWAASLYYHNPSVGLFVIGVTGTKGKSSTIELMNAALEAQGLRTALFTSVRSKILGESVPNTTGNSMPGRFVLQRFLRRAADAGATHILLEVTSEGVSQYRHRFIAWDAAVFVNLHPEHIEAHGGFERYREAKLSFFSYVARFSPKRVKRFFVNGDDPSAPLFSAAAAPHPVHLFGGGFFTANYNAARSLGASLGIPAETIERALASFPGVPGRMEYLLREPFTVLVDYAHTPDSLEALYAHLRAERLGAGRLIAVFGSAGGGRDTWKRPVLGGVAARRADHTILTDEDPFDEDPAAIVEAIAEGFRLEAAGRQSASLEVILDRREAIRRALSLARSGDTVALTGKGSESAIRRARGAREAWKEAEVAREILRELGYSGDAPLPQYS